MASGFDGHSTCGRRPSFVQAVIDNFSRYFLATRTTVSYGGASTKSLLVEAPAKARQLGCVGLPTVFVDSGTENLNAHVERETRSIVSWRKSKSTSPTR